MKLSYLLGTNRDAEREALRRPSGYDRQLQNAKRARNAERKRRAKRLISSVNRIFSHRKPEPQRKHKPRATNTVTYYKARRRR